MKSSGVIGMMWWDLKVELKKMKWLDHKWWWFMWRVIVSSLNTAWLPVWTILLTCYYASTVLFSNPSDHRLVWEWVYYYFTFLYYYLWWHVLIFCSQSSIWHFFHFSSKMMLGWDYTFEISFAIHIIFCICYWSLAKSFNILELAWCHP